MKNKEHRLVQQINKKNPSFQTTLHAEEMYIEHVGVYSLKAAVGRVKQAHISTNQRYTTNK